MQLQQAQARRRTEAQVSVIEREILASYEEARLAINKELQALYAKILSGVKPEDYYNTALKYDRLNKIQAQINKMYSAASVKAGRGTVEASRLAMENSFYQNQYIFQWFTPNVGIDLSFTAIPESIVEASVIGNLSSWQAIGTAARDKIQSTFGSINAYVPESGSLTELLVRNRRDEVLKINRAISSGLLQGQSYRDTARGVSRIIGTTTGGTATGAKASALRIVRTESNRTYSAGSFANTNAIAAQGVRIERIWSAFLDMRTRGSHQALDGQRRPPGEPFQGEGGTALYPGGFGVASEDINCRCDVLDAVDGIPPQVRRGVDPVATAEAREVAKNAGATKSEIAKIKKTAIFDWGSYADWAKSNGLRQTSTGRWTT